MNMIIVPRMLVVNAVLTTASGSLRAKMAVPINQVYGFKYALGKTKMLIWEADTETYDEVVVAEDFEKLVKRYNKLCKV